LRIVRIYQVMEAFQIISARKNGSTFAELARVSGKPEAEVRAVINSHKMNPEPPLKACAMPPVT
jgi:hypothetical protein